MKNLFKTAAVMIAISAVFAHKAGAQTTENNAGKPTEGTGIILSVGPDGGLPLGSLRNRYSWNLGGSVQADIPVIDNKLYFTVLGGFDNYFVKNSYVGNQTNLQIIPAKAGFKYYPVGKFYVQGEAGASFLLNKAESGYDKSTVFSYAPSIGYQFELSHGKYIDAGVRYESDTKFTDGGSTNNIIGLRIAYAFGLK